MVRQHEIQQVHICFRQKNGIEPLTETTVYPDTIWRERKRNGEIKKEGREREERKKETVLHPSKYILQTTKHFSEATIRGQALSQDHPFSSAGLCTYLHRRAAGGKTHNDVIRVLSYAH